MSEGRPFEPLERATISERVRSDIHGRIATGELAPGSPLPAERILAERFGVARTSVREAIQGLVALGVVERRGNRSYVVEQVAGSELPASDGGKRSLRALLEAWRVLELTTAELAAARATTRERNETLQMARRTLPTELGAWSRSDREFHSGIVAACGNPVLAEIHGRIIEALDSTEGVASIVLGVGPNRTIKTAVAASGVEHLAIAEAYVAADTPAMLVAMDRHLGHVQDRVRTMARRLVPATDARPPRPARRALGL